MPDYTVSHSDGSVDVEHVEDVPPAPRTVPLKLRFSRSNSIGSRLIRWFTRSEYSHVEAEHWLGYRIGATPFGVTKSYHNPVSQLEGDGAYLYKYVTLSHEQSLRFWTFLGQQVGKPYDWSGLFGFVSNRDWEDPDKWFCSELVAAGLVQVGVSLLSEKPARVTPRDLLVSPLLFG